MQERKTYNGFANYETWAVSLWLSNDYESYQRYRELARDVLACSVRPTSAHLSPHEAATIALADALRDEFDERSPVRYEASVYADLMNAALGEVDWYELAQELCRELTEE